jgi:hypothetical protein
MFVAEFLICIAVDKCSLFSEKEPVVFKTQEVCIEHAEAKVKDFKPYKMAIVRCKKLEGKQV